MKPDKQLMDFLRGEKFSNSLSVDFGMEKHPGISREEAIIDIIKGKRIVHLGCSDHLEIIEEKIKNKKWLHKLLIENSERCIGIDIDRPSIDYLRNTLGIKDVFSGDIVTDEFPELSENKWDFVVFGELIEHLDNPVEFLKKFREKYAGNVTGFVITVPSVFTKSHLKNIRIGRELINSDHRFWFSPYTICKILVRAGFTPEIISYANLQPLVTVDLIVRKLMKIIGRKIEYPYYYFSSIIVRGIL
jgi:hypothetical protein